VIVHHADALQGTGATFGFSLGFSNDWDGVAPPVHPRRGAFIQLQQSTAYQEAISDRVADTFARLFQVLRDDDPPFDATPSIDALHQSRKQIDVTPVNVVVSELLKFKDKDGPDIYRRFAEAVGPLITKAGEPSSSRVRAELPIVSQQYWDYFTLMRFPSPDAYANLFKSDDW